MPSQNIQEGIGAGWFYSEIGGGKSYRTQAGDRVPIGYNNTLPDDYATPQTDDAVSSFFNGDFESGTLHLSRFDHFKKEFVGAERRFSSYWGPRAVKPLQVQQSLLASGCTLIQRWYADVPWGTEVWRATQILSLYRIMDRPGDIDRDNNVLLASKAKWGVDATLTDDERKQAIDRVKAFTGQTPSIPAETKTAGDFAIAVSRYLLPSTQP